MQHADKLKMEILKKHDFCLKLNAFEQPKSSIVCITILSLFVDCNFFCERSSSFFWILWRFDTVYIRFQFQMHSILLIFKYILSTCRNMNRITNWLSPFQFRFSFNYHSKKSEEKFLQRFIQLNVTQFKINGLSFEIQKNCVNKFLFLNKKKKKKKSHSTDIFSTIKM